MPPLSLCHLGALSDLKYALVVVHPGLWRLELGRGDLDDTLLAFLIVA